MMSLGPTVAKRVLGGSRGFQPPEKGQNNRPFRPGLLLLFQVLKEVQLQYWERPFLKSILGKKPAKIVVYPTPL
jgi:hypothetical protein